MSLIMRHLLTMHQEPNEDNISIKRKRLIFRSWHRGTREIDLLLGAFADKYLPAFNSEQLALYDEFLSNSDPDIYNWITGQEIIPSEVSNAVTTLLLEFFNRKC